MAHPIDITNRDDPTIFNSATGPTVAEVNEFYSTSFPKYGFFDRNIWIYPIPTAAVTNGLRIFWIKRPDELASSSSTPDLPKDFLYLLGEGMLVDVFRKFGRNSESRDALNNWLVGIERMKGLEHAIDREQKYNMKTKFKNYK